MGRAMLRALAELCAYTAPDSALPVADLGCGPGHVTAHLSELGLPVFGVDVSPGMVEIARRTRPGLRFEVGSMTELNFGDAELGGIVAWWSIIHTPPELLSALFAEFHRTLAHGGHLLLGFHVGDERISLSTAYGHEVGYDLYLLQPDHVATLLAGAGFTVTARLRYPGAKRPGACLLAQKPAA
jgi:SAM-dependent methyltransferase